MKIFNVILNGDSAKEFCQQSVEFKKAWILKNTNQTDEALIIDFINNPPKHNDCGCGCGEKKANLPVKEVAPEQPKEQIDEPKIAENSEVKERPKFKRK